MKIRFNPFLCSLAVIALTQSAHANGTAYYFDVDGTITGFGSPSGTYASNGTFWSTSAAGTSATAAYPTTGAPQLTFGNTGTDLASSSFVINLVGTTQPFGGLAINSSSANITLQGTGNVYLSGGQTWTVAAGSTLNENGTFQANGMNFNNMILTLSGGGAYNFGTGIGNNSNGLITQNMTGTGAVNLLQTAAATTANSGGYTLTAGTLNFGTGSAAVAFSQFASGKFFSINGGVIDNTGSAVQTLALGAGTYSLGGDFTFTGTRNLSLGTAAVALTANRQITTTANTLTIGGVIGGGFSLTKAGAGTLALSGVNTYSGATNVNGGTLELDYSTQDNSKILDSAVLALGGGTLQLSGGTHTEVVASTTLNVGASSVTRASGTGVLRMNAITRNVGATVDFGAASIADTDTSDTNGILGGWATVNGTDWATSAPSAADTPITALASYTTTTSAGNTASNYSSANITVDSDQSPGAVITPSSLRFNNPAANTLTLTGATNTVTSGGILVTSAVGNNLSKITGGTLLGAVGTDLVAIQNNPLNGLTIESIIANNTTASGLTKSGAGLLTLTAANTYTGATTVGAGTLKLGNATAINTTSGLTAALGATVDINGNNSTVGTLSGGGTLTNNAASGTATVAATGGTWTGSITDGSTAKVAVTLNSTAINLGGTNTFSGGLTIGNTVNTPLTISSGAALGNGLITVANNSSLRLSAGQTVTGKTVSIQGTGGGPSGGNGNGALNLVSGTATWAGDVKFGAATNSGRIGVTGSGTLTIGGNISNNTGTSGNGLDVVINCDTTLGSGVVILSGTSNTYTGSTIIGRGVLKIGASNVLPATSSLQVGTGGSTGARFDLNGFNQTVGGLQRTVVNILESSILNNGAADSTLTISTAPATAFSHNGVIKDGTTNKVAIIKTGSGSQTLTSANTYTGNTTVNAGTLELATTGSLKFVPTANGVSNKITGTGTVSLKGSFNIDLTGAAAAPGNSWTLVDVGTLSATFDPAFAVTNFTESANVWTKPDGANVWTFKESTGVLTYTVASAYASWIDTSAFGLTAGQKGENADPDNDGIPNLLEFVLNGNPSISDPSSLPVLNVTPTNFEFTFNRRVDSLSPETTQTFQYSTDLTHWTDVVVPAGNATVGAATITVTTGTPADSVKVSIPISTFAPATKLFGRIQVTK